MGGTFLKRYFFSSYVFLIEPFLNVPCDSFHKIY